MQNIKMFISKTQKTVVHLQLAMWKSDDKQQKQLYRRIAKVVRQNKNGPKIQKHKNKNKHKQQTNAQRNAVEK